MALNAWSPVKLKSKIDNGGVVLVDFKASRYPECRPQVRALERVAPIYDNQVKTGTLDIGEYADASYAYNVTTQPTLLIFKDGALSEELNSFTNATMIARALNNAGDGDPQSQEIMQAIYISEITSIDKFTKPSYNCSFQIKLVFNPIFQNEKNMSKLEQITGLKHPLTVSREELLDESGDGSFRQLIQSLLVLAVNMETIRNNFGKMIDLTGIDYTILSTIYHVEDENPVYINTIANLLHFSGSFITIEVNKLVALKLIRKTKDAKDTRRVILSVTNKGKKLLDELTPFQREVNDQFFLHLTKRELHTLIKIADKLSGDSDKAVELSKFHAVK